VPAELELDADQIVVAAVDIMRESGLDAISMRSVATRLGVTPPPVYARIGNKDALIDAVADHLLDDLAPTPDRDEAWADYARRWTRQLRARLTDANELILMIEPPPVAAIAVAANAVNLAGPLRFTPITLSNNVSEVSSSDGASGLIPALLTSPSSRPQRDAAASTTPGSSSQLPTWHANG
jgi:AcrR family transcriptional regulator